MLREIEDYLAQRRAEGLAAETIKQRRYRLGALASFLRGRGKTRPADAKAEDVEAYLSSLKERGLSLSYRNGHAGTARDFFRWLTQRGKVLADPTRTVVLRRPEEEDLLEPPLEEEEVMALLDGMPKRNALDLRNILVVELLYSCGLRRSECLGLTLRDIDLEARELHVRHGKGGKPRTLPMMRGVYGAVRNWLALRRSLLRGPDHGALLLTRSGTRLTQRGFMSLMESLNGLGLVRRRFHAHLFRHSIAVHLLRGGADLRFVQSFLGHSDLDTSKTYLRLISSDLRKSYDDAMPQILVEG